MPTIVASCPLQVGGEWVEEDRGRREVVSLELIRPDVAVWKRDPEVAPLISSRAGFVVSGVYGRAARQQCVSEGGSAVVLEGAEERVNVAHVTWATEAARTVAVQIEPKGSDAP